MAAPTAQSRSAGAAPPSSSAAVPRSLWSRLRGSRFLFVSIAIHFLFGLGAAVYVVRVYRPQRKLTFKGGPPSPNHSERVIEHQVRLAQKQNTMSAPMVSKRIVTTGLSKITLPAMPAIPTMNGAAPTKMAGVGGAGFALPGSVTGAQASTSGGGL